ncbi:YciI family protein [uncultured Limnobacter sp.]|uniref:YciI family protein n=1 Tax=Limnobacter sp. TaxID=2003368 RepID=UPI0030F54B76
MKYLCLAHEEEALFNAMPREEWLALRQETLGYVEALKASGHLLATHALQSASNGVLVRVRNQRLVTTDGPFVETKEQLGGYFLIEAHDFNEALRIASQWPSARLGTIEIRPIEETLREDSRYGDPS